MKGNKNKFELVGGVKGSSYKCMKEIEGKSTLVRVCLRFELARVRVIRSQL